MSYENQLIREATGEGLPSFSEAHEDYFSDETLEAEDRDVTNETGDQQGETKMTRRLAKLLLKVERNCKRPNVARIQELHRMLNERIWICDYSYTGAHQRYKLQ